MSPSVAAALNETVSFHEALRRLGYRSEDIFVQCAPDAARSGKPSAFTLLRASGLSAVTLTSGIFEIQAEVEEFEREWPSFAQRWNSDPTLNRDVIYEKSFVRRGGASLITLLVNKGHPMIHSARQTLENKA